MNFKNFAWILILLAFFPFGGCRAPANTSGQEPALPMEDLVATIAAATIQALPTNTIYPTRTAPPTQRLSPTPSPTETPIATIPKPPTPTLPQPGELTPSIINNPFTVYYTATPMDWSCEVARTRPEWGTVIKPGYDFRPEWKIYNNGAKRWSALNFEMVYTSGYKMHNPDSNGKPLLYNVYVNDKVLLQVQMTAPKEIGLYTAYWGLRSTRKNAQPFCAFSVTIRVNEKVTVFCSYTQHR